MFIMSANGLQKAVSRTGSTKKLDDLCANVLIAKLKSHRAALLNQQAKQARFETAVKALETARGCFLCGHCLAYSTWQPDDLTEHIEGRHPAEADSATTPCPYCFLDFPSAALALHQAEHFSPLSPSPLAKLFHCSVPGCLVKSPSELEVQRHADRCHADQTNAAVVDAEKPSPMADNFDIEDCRLQCPNCAFCSSSWPEFVQHQARDVCARQNNASFRYGLSHCSECGVVSTEARVIDEHIDSEHSKTAGALRIYEEVTSCPVTAGLHAIDKASQVSITLPQQQQQQQQHHQPLHFDILRETLKRPGHDQADSSRIVKLARTTASSVDAPADTSASPGATCASQLHFGQNASHFESAENVDEEEAISLPFSQTALCSLLGDLCSEPNQRGQLMQKMRAYSQYHLIRQLSRGRTVAYKCQCGRVFHTVRRPGANVRPSTLADARRHVMGVHARISHDLLTVCCQASRISRENGWRLYPDHLLLKLASERPCKATPLQQLAGGGSDKQDCGRVEGFASLLFSPAVTAQLTLLPELPQSSSTLTPPSQQLPPLPSLLPPIQPHEEVTEEQKMSTLLALRDGELERVIDLPYSWTALERLISAVCDQDMMSALRIKMDYYSTYKVAVTRQASRRMFRCSGCSASSPHGMGDIRKHILGVHAKVPDRLKAACLHASRLSRDDNRLLPDTLLLQLAKLKWKGTTSTAAAANGSGFIQAESTQTHLDCSQAGLRMQPTTTLNDNEDSEEADAEPSEMEPTPERPRVPQDYHIVMVTRVGDADVYKCSVCGLTASSAGPIRGHIVRHHLSIPGHKCALCGRLYALRRHVFRHHMLAHPGHEFHLLQYSPYRYAMNRVCLVKPGGDNRVC